jgi:hypothetical protein
MKNKNQYQQDYEKSRAKEFQVENLLQTKYNLLTETTDDKVYHPWWDISSTSTTHNNRIIKWEVKYNSNYQVDSVVIEACKIVDECKIPSGLSITEADYYILCFEDDSNFYAIKVEKLKELVANFKHIKKHVGYDKNNYQLQIFPKAYLLQFAITL